MREKEGMECKGGPAESHRRTKHFPSGNRHSISNAYHSASRVIFARPRPVHPRISCHYVEIPHLHSAPDRNVSHEGGGPEAPTAGSGSKHHQRTVVGSCMSAVVPKVVAVLDTKSSPKMHWFLFAFCITPVSPLYYADIPLQPPPSSPSKHTRHPLYWWICAYKATAPSLVSDPPPPSPRRPWGQAREGRRPTERHLYSATQLQEWLAQAVEGPDRCVVFLCGAPAAGKSTLAQGPGPPPRSHWLPNPHPSPLHI